MIDNFQSRYTNGNKKTTGIKIFHWNKGGSYLVNKMPEIKTIIDQHHPHILGLSEANLLDTHDKKLAEITDYNLHESLTISNPLLKSSRIVVFTHKDLIAKLRPDLMSQSYSSIWLEVGLPHHKKFLVCQTYREWQFLNQNGDKSSSTIPEQLSRWLSFLDQWEKALDTGMEVICLGDMNLNHCNWTDSNLPHSNQSYKLRELTSALFSRIIPLGVAQLVSGTTRHFPGQIATGLDHYYTNRPDKTSPVQKFHNGGSDHMLIGATRYSRSIKSSPKYIRKRCYKGFNTDLFIQNVRQISWLDVYLCDDVDQAVHLLSKHVTDILDKAAPMKAIQIRTNYAPWISKETYGMMKERNRLQKVASETKERSDWKNYKQIRNKVKNRLKYEETKWQRTSFEQCGSNSAKIWKNVKSILNWKRSGSPNQLFYQGLLRTKSQDIADSQNQFFIGKVQDILADMPVASSNPLEKLQNLMSARTCMFSLTAVHPDQVNKIISTLTNSSAFGLDNIDTSIIKLIRAEILPAVTHVINLSILHRKFPTVWKKSKVVPLYKKGDTLNPKNYRPVAIVPILSKILERVVFNQMIQYLTQNSLLHPNHHAYRLGHNTTTALIQMYNGWVKAVESEQLVGACMLDMSAAFDLVDHELLIKKLALYGFDDSFLSWVRSYLSGRSQCVVIEGCLSKLLPVPTGVPQGSILGPLLYTIFTNELPEAIHDAGEVHGDQVGGQHWPEYHLEDQLAGSICCYADDTTLTCSESSHADLSTKLTNQYRVVAEFMKNNKLKLNDDKTHLIVMGSGHRAQAAKLVEMKTSTEVIKPSSSEKLLGCWISENLKWSEHIRDNKDSLMASLNTRINALKKISKLGSFQNRKMLANGIFMSKLVYLIALWGGCGTMMRRSLQMLQNKVARMVTKLEWSTPTEVLLKQVGWLSVHQLVFFHSVLLIYKVKKDRVPENLYNMFSSTYSYDTRQARGGMIKLMGIPKLDLSKNSFRWRGANQFNQLPETIRTSPNVMVFKARAKEWIRSNVSLN